MPQAPSPSSLLRILLVCALSLASAQSALAQSSRNSSIGVWPFLVGNIDSDVDNIIATSKAAGLDTLYIHCWRTTGSQNGELRIRDEAGTWNSAWGRKSGLVTLSRMIDKAHTAGLQVVGVVQVFRDGGPFPSDRAHQTHMIERVLRYLVHSYDGRGRRVYALDGIAFDYIRWFGGQNSPAEVNRFLRDARAEVGTMPLHAFVIAGASAMDGNSYNNTFRSYAQARSYLSQNYGQDWESMAKVLDVLMPMAYTANGHVYGTNTAWMEGFVNVVARYGRQAIQNAGTSCALVPAIRTWNSTGQSTTPATIDACFRGALRGGADGTMAFRYYTAKPHPTWFTALGRWCAAGPDLPIARLSTSTSGLTVAVQTGTSSSARYAASQLRVRLDADGDGSFESTSASLGTAMRTLPGAGARVVSARIEDPSGAYAIGRVEVGVPPFFTPTTAQISAASGGTVFMRLNPGVSEAGRYYALFVTLSGTKPGAAFERGVTLPINIDYLTIVASGLLNQGPFVSWFGAVNGFGFANPSMTMPAGLLPTAWIGQTMHVAALDLDPATLTPRYASNAIAIKILP